MSIETLIESLHVVCTDLLSDKTPARAKKPVGELCLKGGAPIDNDVKSFRDFCAGASLKMDRRRTLVCGKISRPTDHLGVGVHFAG